MSFIRTYSVFVLLLYCLNAGNAVAASTVTVETTAMEVTDAKPLGNENGLCSLDEAFVVFGGSPAFDCVPQVSGDDSPLIIELQAAVYSLGRSLYISENYPADVIELRGNGATIERSDAATEDFGLMRASASSSGSSLHITDLTFRNAETTEGGAALYVVGFNLELSGVTFRNNYSMGQVVATGQGGALIVSSFSGNELNIKFQHCRFEGNTADRIAGAVYLGEVSGTISDTTFIDNYSTSAGALYVTGSNLAILDSEFIGNHADSAFIASNTSRVW